MAPCLAGHCGYVLHRSGCPDDILQLCGKHMGLREEAFSPAFCKRLISVVLPAAFTQVQREPRGGPRRGLRWPLQRRIRAREDCLNAPTFNFEVFFDCAAKILANVAEALLIFVNQLEPSEIKWLRRGAV